NGFAIFWFGVCATGLLFAQAKRFQVIHIGDMAMWPLGWFAKLCNPRARIVISAHGTDVVYANRPGLRPALYRTYLRLGAVRLSAAKVIANSGATRKALARHGFFHAAIVPLAARPSGSAPNAKQNHNQHVPEKFLLFSGRLTRQKGCGWFIQSVLPQLPEEVSLYVAGVVTDASERDALNDPRVRFLGPVDPVELASLRRNALAVIAPNIKCSQTDFEGFGLSATEGAADGGVVIAADLFGLKTAVIDQVTGFLVSPGNPAAWREKICDVNSWSEKERHCFVANAINAVRDHYSWERVTRQTLDVYGLRVCEDSKRRAA
ncbi:MAG: glycosyltransferase family 4 protein, partial [Pseudomonadota bacterium]